MGGWKQKSGWIQIPPVSCIPFTFPFLSQLSVCLIVSRVRAYLTTDQHMLQTVLCSSSMILAHTLALALGTTLTSYKYVNISIQD